MQTYKHYQFNKTADGVAVFDPRWPAKPVYVAADVARAKRWVAAFRDGVTWAVLAAR